ncbi:hypothetical protein [Mucilaginibacter auburnensis]|uniref:Lipocalin-like protein n=1 Tax=Mucilaginibacter auburnensis TaxID=1457233 RepID=A0A2H9VL49_9SPHI|nr:hypothetical protein [Mucilaginibacter auburnensis]PJJ79058.1 hypothetical protein CLV57_2182 [Mucilaginibacter auburnensis]
MRKSLSVIITVLVLSSFVKISSLKGTWQYAGGMSGGKFYSAPKDYSQQRVYTKDKFEAFLLEKGEKPLKYESGDYSLTADSCFETQTYSLQPSFLTGKLIHYSYTIKNDTLFLKGKLPNGIEVEDFWKKVK